MSKATIEIDGSHGEGGGQVLRTSLALSLITGKPFHLRKIRAKRTKPGLQAQHLMSVRAAAEIGAATAQGDRLGSGDLRFEPGAVRPGQYHFKVGTAGATSLVLHTICLPLALAGGASTVTIEGGTHVKASPCFHFLERSWAPYLKSIGVHVEVSLERAGFYPRGGGRIHACITSTSDLRGFTGMAAAPIRRVRIHSVVAGLPDHVADRLVQTAHRRLSALGLEVETCRQAWPGGPGCMLGIELTTIPAPTFLFALGERGKPAEVVAKEAIEQIECFLAVQPLGVDEHSADQMLLPLALAKGASEFRVAAISSHLRTNATVIQHFLTRAIKIEGAVGEPGIVRIP